MINRLVVIVLLSWNSWMNYAQTPFDCDGQVFMSLIQNNNEGQLYEIVSDGITSDDVPFPATFPYNINSIGYRKTDNFIYGIDPSEHFLYRIDAEGSAEFIYDLELNAAYYAGDVTIDGNYLVLFNSNALAKIDLRESTYPITYVPIQTAIGDNLVSCADVAFHPGTGLLYGYDGVEGQLVQIDTETGVIKRDEFQENDYNNILTALFFNEIGELYGIGKDNLNNLSILFQFNLETGLSSRTNFTQNTGEQDGCSCPYKLSIQQYPTSSEAFPCTEVEYVFKIANFSGETKQDAILENVFPDGFEITEITHHPFGSIDETSLGTNKLQLTDFEIPIGVDSIVLKLKVPENATGNYLSQSALQATGVTSGVIESLVSDFPYSMQDDDPSPLMITPVKIAAEPTYPDTLELCWGDTLYLTYPEVGGINYFWNTGAQTTTFPITKAGFYELTIATACESEIRQVTVVNSDLNLSLGNRQTINFGENVQIVPEIISFSPIVSYEWSSGSGEILNCPSCPYLEAQTPQTTDYQLKIENESGCTISARVLVEVNYPVFAPNIFSPNGDITNDQFYLQSITPDLVINYLRVFNRLGEIIFEQTNTSTNDASKGWDGTYKRKNAEQGVYIWTAEIAYPDGRTAIIFGDVMLVR